MFDIKEKKLKDSNINESLRVVLITREIKMAKRKKAKKKTKKKAKKRRR